MKEINQIPVRTSINYGLNCLKIEDSDFVREIKNFSNISAMNLPVPSKEFDFEIKRVMDNEFFIQSEQNNNYTATYKFNGIHQEECELKFAFDKDNKTLVDNVHIIGEQNSKFNVLIRYNSSVRSYHNGIIRITLEDNTIADITILSDFQEDSNNYITIDSRIGNGSTLNLNLIDFSGRNAVYCYNSSLAGENSQSKLNSVYIGDKNSMTDLNYNFDLYGKKSSAIINVIGALKDSAKKNFKGTINFVKGAKKSYGAENEFCILLSKNAKSKALPMLLCGEEDVDGKHSTACGKADEKQLFYIMSRGLSYNEALRLIVKSKFNTVINALKNEKIKEEILDIIDRKLSDENQ